MIKKRCRSQNLSPITTYSNDEPDTRTQRVQISFTFYNGSSYLGGKVYAIDEIGTHTLTSQDFSTPFTRAVVKYLGYSKNFVILDTYISGTANDKAFFTANFESITPTNTHGLKLSQIMLNVGSVALPYEPLWVARKITLLNNGYKICKPTKILTI